MRHLGVELVDEILTQDFRKKLEDLAGVKEEDITITERGFKFSFKNSLQANRFRVIKYHDNVIVEFRMVTDNLIEGFADKLVHESVVKPQEVYTKFQDVTNIYLDYV